MVSDAKISESYLARQLKIQKTVNLFASRTMHWKTRSLLVTLSWICTLDGPKKWQLSKKGRDS
jgi:hypothetical protein